MSDQIIDLDENKNDTIAIHAIDAIPGAGTGRLIFISKDVNAFKEYLSTHRGERIAAKSRGCKVVWGTFSRACGAKPKVFDSQNLLHRGWMGETMGSFAGDNKSRLLGLGGDLGAKGLGLLGKGTNLDAKQIKKLAKAVSWSTTTGYEFKGGVEELLGGGDDDMEKPRDLIARGAQLKKLNWFSKYVLQGAESTYFLSFSNNEFGGLCGEENSDVLESFPANTSINLSQVLESQF